MKKAVVFDMDDVLVNLRTAALEELNRRFKKSYRLDDWTSFDLSTLYGVSFDEVKQAFRDSRIYGTCKSEPGATQLVHQYRRDGFDVLVCTSRENKPPIVEATKRELYNMGVLEEISHVVFAKHGGKGQMLRQWAAMYEIETFYDDHVNNLMDVEKSLPTTKTVLVERPWSKHKLWIGTRISGLHEHIRSSN